MGRLEELRRGGRRALAKGITLLESTREQDAAAAQELLEEVGVGNPDSFRIGISGSPGVGKSTFIETLGLFLIAQGKRVAVLAVDPSSPLAGGSIMGDKIRMEGLLSREEAFIRPSPTGGGSGGVARRTFESMLLCEAAGYDVILVETVGVGQSEYEVASMVDFFLVLVAPGAGDEVQGIKRGIMELADAVVVHKADGILLENAAQTCLHYANALRLLESRSFWEPQALCCSSLQEHNIDKVWELLSEYRRQAREKGELARKRAQQGRAWMRRVLHSLLEEKLQQEPRVQRLLPRLEQQVVEGKTSPHAAARRLLELL